MQLSSGSVQRRVGNRAPPCPAAVLFRRSVWWHVTPLVVVAALVAAPTPPARAQDDNPDMDRMLDLSLEELLDEVVVTASKDAQRLQDAPAVISVLTREDIERWGYRSIAEVLTHVVGFYVLDDHMVPNAGVRGVSAGLRGESSILKVMVDGHSVAFRHTSGNWLGPELIPMSAVERIEIVRGAASSLYGADAFLGVVNIITRNPKKLSGAAMTSSLMFSGGRPGAGQDMVVGGERGGTSFLSAFRLHYEDRSGLRMPASSPSPRIPAYATDRVATDLTQYSAVGYGQVSHQVGKHKVSASTYASLLDRAGEFSDWQQLANGIDAAGRTNQNRISLAQGYFDIRYESQFTADLDFSADLLAFVGGPTGRDRLEVGSDFSYVRRRFFSRGVDMEISAGWRPLKNFTLRAGLTNSTDLEDRPQAVPVLKVAAGGRQAGDTVGSTPSGDVLLLANTGAYLQTMWSVFPDWLSLTTGLRYDYHNIYGSQFSVRLASVFKASRELGVKLIYGTAFKAPSTLLLYGAPVGVGDILGNPSLKPSYVHTLETQISYRFAPYVTWSVGLVYNRILDKAEFVPQGINQVARNIASVTTYSLESQLDISYKEWIRAYGNVGFNHTQRQTRAVGYQADLVGSDNVVYPVFIGNAGVTLGMPGVPMRAGVESSVVSDRRASDANILEHGESYWLGGYMTWGGTLSFTGFHMLPQRDTTFTLVVRNIFNQQTADPGFAGFDYPAQQRFVMLQVRQEF